MYDGNRVGLMQLGKETFDESMCLGLFGVVHGVVMLPRQSYGLGSSTKTSPTLFEQLPWTEKSIQPILSAIDAGLMLHSARFRAT
jgi:hypothetical protein